ncbi:MAG: isochorismatase family cysteine hydrolase [Candidatus Thermoplasmatota archaeon]|nr:isochorismatase family cysteine hydrolase [Candidatus Thermoplasmatota archaeon]
MISEPYLTSTNIDEKVETWLSSIERKRKWKGTPKRFVLLVLDMQRFFLEPESHAFVPAGRAIIPRIKELVHNFNGPVIFTRHVKGSPDNLMNEWWRDAIEGELSEIIPELAPLVENIIIKEHYSAFFDTALDERLGALGVDSILITGILSDLCCETTTRDAFMRGYRSYFLADCTATSTEERHRSTLNRISNAFGEVISSKEQKWP